MKLKDCDPNVSGSDYVNANYIKQNADDITGTCEFPPDPNSKIYIATQGML